MVHRRIRGCFVTTPATEAAWAGIGREAGRVPASLPADRAGVTAFGVLAGTVSLIVREVQEQMHLANGVLIKTCLNSLSSAICRDGG